MEQIPTRPNRLPAFHVMAKPTGPICNLDCKYCFYLEKEHLYPDKKQWRMPDDVLEAFIRQHIEAHQTPEVQFAWQGGEPTLLGVDFFRRVVELEQQYANGKVIHNAFQTNGILLNDEWGAFLAENNFLIGLSIDGPEALHNRYRVDKGGHDTFKRVMRGLDMLKKHGVEFNTLTCVNRHNAHHPLDVYRFLREVGSGFMQFIPIVERAAEEPREDGLSLVHPGDGEVPVTEWSVKALSYGKFLAAIFDEWVRRDVGQVYVQIFDVSLEAWMGMNPSLCIFRDTCGDGLALEHNGDLYSCDHFVYPEYRLGNVAEDSLAEMVHSPEQRKFGTDKRDTLPEYCRKCDYYFACHGGCPKHRFAVTPDGEPNLNYLCAGYKHFFGHIDQHMRFMANELRNRRAPANIMAHLAQQEQGKQSAGKASPNDPCPCGSGRKYKKCCGAAA